MAIPDEIEDAVGDLWRFYDEHASQARQHEDLRASVTSILAGFAAALVGFAGIGGLKQSDIPAGVLVILIGALGALLSLKHYERNRFHVRVLGEVGKEINRLRAQPGSKPQLPKTLRKNAEREHAKKFRLRRESREPEVKPESGTDPEPEVKPESGTDPEPAVKSESETDLEPGTWLVRVRLFELWVALPLAISVIGVVVVVIASL